MSEKSRDGCSRRVVYPANYIMLSVDFCSSADAMSDVGPILQQARKELLDLSGRNRLINTPRHRARANTIEIRGERSEAVLRLLVEDGRGHGLPAARRAGRRRCRRGAVRGSGAARRATSAPLPHHQDLWLQTELGAERLQGRLLRLYYDARTHYEERGVGVLYLALGFLEWYEAPAARSPAMRR